MKINKRLKQIGDLVEANSFCLDVGCDHAFLDIYLVKKECGIRAIASDIAKGPLDSARNNIAKEKLEDKIEVRLGNGLDTYSKDCLLYTSPRPRDRQKSRMPSSA